MARLDADPSAAANAAPFVGRAAELSALVRALERAAAGRGQIVMLAGDAGMGKTRTAQELARCAEDRGVRVLWGRCSEEPGAPPFWPWTQAIRAHAAMAGDAELHEALGPGADFVQAIVPELAARIGPTASETSVTDAADAPHRRFQQFDALARFWLRAAGPKPLLLILDNLHGADPTSLRLLVFLAEELAESRLMVLGTYRLAGISRGHPLADALADLARAPAFERFELRGLDRDATESYIAQTLAAQPDAVLVDYLYRQTEGVPLFLVETLRLLRVDRRPGMPIAAWSELSPRQIPATIREVIGKRLSRLSPACCRLLDIAAVIGRAFDGQLLAALDPASSDEAQLSALEEAQAAHVIEPLAAANQYQFSHSLIRETLYDELLPARLHLQIGTLLEVRIGTDDGAQLPQLAYHFGAALPGGSPRKALDCARRAAERAMSLLAFEEAARLFGLALRLQEQHFATDRETRCALLLAIGAAQHRAGLVGASLASYLAAAELARDLGNAAEFSAAALGYEDAGWRGFHSGLEAASLLEEALAQAPASDAAQRARLESALCRACVYANQPQRFDAAYLRATALARKVGDPYVLFKALASMAPTRVWPAYLEARRAAATEAIALAERHGRADWVVDDIAYFHFGDLLEAGDIAAARALAVRYAPVTEAMRQPFLLTMSLSGQVLLAIFDGRYAEAEALARKTFEIGRRAVSAAHAQGVYGLQMFTLQRDRGRLAEALPLLQHFVATTPQATTWRPGLALLYAELGLRDDARKVFESLAADDFGAVLHDAQALTESAYLSEVCVDLGDAARAPTLYRALQAHAGRNLIGGNTVVCLGPADRYLGALASVMGRDDAAQRHFEAALALDGADAERPGVAQTLAAYAAHLLRSRDGDGESARALLERARHIAAGYGMTTLVRRCAELLDAQPAPRRGLPDGLSEREVEVLRLLVAGRSNREIGARMFISPYTVANHVRHILGKIGAANRTEAASYAIRHGLAQP